MSRDESNVYRTFVLTDIVGSTRLWRDHRAEMAASLRKHDDLVGILSAVHKGHLVRTKGEGDSTFTAFRSPADAIQYVVELQRRIQAEN